MNKLTLLYKEILESLGVTIDEQGLTSRVNPDGSTPIMVERRRLALPTTQILKTSPWDTVVPFHPLSENVMLGESPVLKNLKAMVNLKLTQTISLLFIELIQIAADTDSHTRLTSKQKQLLKEIDVDHKSVDTAESIISRVDMTKHRLVNVYLRRGGKLDGKTYQRVSTVSFPIFEHFEPMETEVKDANGKSKKHYRIFDLDMRKRDKEAFVKFFQWLIPDAQGTRYSTGSNSTVAPYFDALMRSYAKVTERLNEVAETFKKPLGDTFHEVHTPLHWLERFEDLNPYRYDVTTPLPFNDGAQDSGNAVPVTTPPVQATAATWEESIKPPVAPTQRPATSNAPDDGSEWLNMVNQMRTPANTNAPFAHLAKGNTQTSQRSTQPVPPQYAQAYMPPQAPAPFAHLAQGNVQPMGNYPQPAYATQYAQPVQQPYPTQPYPQYGQAAPYAPSGMPMLNNSVY